MIEINSTVGMVTAPVTVSLDTPAVPAVGDDVAIPSPIAAPLPGSYQQLTVRNRIFRYQDNAGTPSLYVLLVTDNPIT